MSEGRGDWHPGAPYLTPPPAPCCTGLLPPLTTAHPPHTLPEVGCLPGAFSTRCSPDSSNSLRTWVSGSATIFAPTAPVPTQGLSPASPLPAVSMCFCTSPPSVPQPPLACPFTGRGKSPLREGLVRWLLPGTVASAPARGSPPGPKHPSAQVLLGVLMASQGALQQVTGLWGLPSQGKPFVVPRQALSRHQRLPE